MLRRDSLSKRQQNTSVAGVCISLLYGIEQFGSPVLVRLLRTSCLTVLVHAECIDMTALLYQEGNKSMPTAS
jgi:hypothetical protein